MADTREKFKKMMKDCLEGLLILINYDVRENGK